MTQPAAPACADLSRPCARCQGQGFRTFKGFTSVEGKVYPDRVTPCDMCGRTGTLAAPDFDAIFQAIKGRKPQSLRSAKPDTKAGDYRAAYVWRMARFHGGADMTMPVMASLMTEGDSYRAELDAYADEVAKWAFGSDLRAARRWVGLLG